MRKYIIMGPQGSGKGTQAKMLARDFDLVHISVGDIFRWHVAEPHQARDEGAALHEGGPARPGRDGLRRGEVAPRHPRLAHRLRAGRLPAQRRADRVLPRELRHRRGDRDRAARGGRDRAHAEPAAVLELRPRLQPDPAAAQGRGRVRQLRRAPGAAARRHARGDPRAAQGLPREDAADPRPAAREGADRQRRRDADAGRRPGADAPASSGCRPPSTSWRRRGRRAERGRDSAGSAARAARRRARVAGRQPLPRPLGRRPAGDGLAAGRRTDAGPGARVRPGRLHGDRRGRRHAAQPAADAGAARPARGRARPARTRSGS